MLGNTESVSAVLTITGPHCIAEGAKKLEKDDDARKMTMMTRD